MDNNPSASESKRRFEHILSTLHTYRLLWILPTIAGMVLSAAYVLVLRQETWTARQSLIVRDDLLGQAFKPGRFESIESMKSAQETILEIARKPQVIRNALKELGPESKGIFGLGSRGWPSEEVIEDVQGAITFAAPNGAEFGKTEVIVLNAKASSRERSRQFIELLLNEIIVKVDEVRSLRLQSMEVELLQARDAALMALEDSKGRLRAMDQMLGPDVGAMTALNDSQSNDNTIKRDISQIRLEKRQVETDLEFLRSTLAELVDAKENPDQILNISGELSRSQPALDELKKELVKSQKDLAVAAGRYTTRHPSYIQAKTSIAEMQQQIHQELDSAIRGTKSSIAVTETKLDRLNAEFGNLDGRLISLSSNRAESLTLFADLETRTELANKAQSDLSEIQGLSQARNANLLTRVDEPQVSTKPDGLGKKAFVLAGGLGGLMLGLSLVMLVAAPVGDDEDSESAEREGNLERSFESKNFEKVVMNATAAATAATAAATAAASTAASSAIQSASKAKQYFLTPKSEQDQATSATKSKPATIRTAAVASQQEKVTAPPIANHPKPMKKPAVQIGPTPTPAKPAPSETKVEVSAPAPVNPTVEVTAAPTPAPTETAISGSITPATSAPAKPAVPATTTAPTPAMQAPVTQVPEVAALDTTEPVSDVELREAFASVSEMAASQLAALHQEAMKITDSKQSASQPVATPTPVEVVDRAFELDAEPIEPPASPVMPVPDYLEKHPTTDDKKKEDRFESAIQFRAETETIQIQPASELKRRDPNVRPVDLAKSVEQESSFVRVVPKPAESSSTGQDKTPRRENPFLKDLTAKPEAASEESREDSVPDQIKKLRASISKFSKPNPEPPTDQ